MPTRLSIENQFSVLRKARANLGLLAVAALTLTTSGLLTARHATPAHPASQGDGASIIGVILDDRGDPVSDVKVTASSLTTTVSVLTGPDGRYEFRNLKPGQFQIVALAARFKKEKLTVIIARPDDIVNPPPIKLTPSSLHVTVLDSANQPLPGVALAVHLKDLPQGEAQERRTTDDSGDAYFGRLAPGSYQLSATLRGYDEYRNDVFISSGITTEFPVQLSVAPVIPINEKALVRYGLPALPSKNVLSLYQDSEGWLWFGTDKGIARFNGTEFKSSSAGSNYEQLSGAEIRSITEDASGTTWVATPDSIHRITMAGADTVDALAVRDPRQLLADSRYDVWLAGGGGLARISSTETKVISEEDCKSIAEDKAGRIWVATQRGLSIVDHDRIMPVEITFSTGTAAPREAAPEVRQVFVDHAGGVWLATSKGAYHLDNAQSGNGPALMRAVAVEQGSSLLESGVRAIAEDSHSRLWFAAETGGAVLYDPAQNESERVRFLDKDRVTTMLASRDGQMWFGCDNGAVQSDLYSFVSFTASRGLPDNEINAVFEMPATLTGGASRLWFFSSTGISRMEGDRFQSIEGFRSNINVHNAAVDAEGNAWFATAGGSLRLSGKTLTQFNEGSGLASNNVRWVTAVDKGTALVFATSRGVSIFKNGEMSVLRRLEGYDVRHVFEDHDGILWFATSRGAVRFNPTNEETEIIDTERGLADNDTRWIIRFGDALLIATRAGIQSYDVTAPKPAFRIFDGDSTSTMFVDRDGFLWTGTDQGQVKKYTIIGGQAISTVYAGESNALSSSQINSISQDSDGNIWIATDRGAVRHVPLKTVAQAQVLFEVDGRPYQRTESNTVEVSYGRHRFTFRFAAVCFTGPPRYLYRVDGDRGAEWKVLPAQQAAEGEISLLDLEDGLHSFELIALNRDLYGGATPAATIQLSVGLPFWKRWWFYVVSALVLATAAAGFFVARQRQSREYVLPRELRSFVPIEPNPYIVGNPIRTEAMFFGRQDDFRYVRTKLEGVSQGVVIVFCGERRVGKSSILYQVQNGRLGDRFIPVFIDLQEMVVSSDSEFFARISRLISEAVAKACQRSPQPTVASGMGAAVPAAQRQAALSPGSPPTIPSTPQFDGRNPYPIFLDFLDEVLECIGDRTLLMLFDEYELLEGKVDEGKLSPEFFTFLAGLMDNRERLALIFTGSRRLEERDKKYWRELLRRSLFRKVSFLSLNDTVRLATEPVAGRVVYARGVVDEICRLTAGQPFYTQVICQNIVDFLNEHRRNWVTLTDLKQVIAEVVDNPLPQMIYAWDALSDDEKLVLSLLSEVLTDGSAYATAFALRESVKLNDYPVNLSEHTIRLTLEELFRRELVEKDAADGFRFKIDLLRLWTHRSHSIWQVVKEVRTR